MSAKERPESRRSRTRGRTASSAVLEALEVRRHFNVTAVMVGTTLVITGDANGNTITVDQEPDGDLVVSGANDPGPFQRAEKINISSEAGNDVITLMPAVTKPADITADDGDDRVSGGSGVNKIVGGLGADTISGGSQDDLLRGDDALLVELGGKIPVGIPANDTIDGLGGDDEIHGDWGNDALHGGEGMDKLWGGDGGDTIAGNAGGDKAYGEAGEDFIYGDFLAVPITYYSGPVTEGSDLLYGGDEGDRMFGDTPGTESIAGVTGGIDTMYGEAGGDTLFGYGGNDNLFAGKGTDILWGGNGDDYLHGKDGVGENDVLYGGPDNDTIVQDADDTSA